MIFRPHVAKVLPPRGGLVDDADASRAYTKTVGNVLIPIGRTVDLISIPASGVEDYFLWQPFQNTLESAYIGAAVNGPLANRIKVQLIQKTGNSEFEVNSEQYLSEVSIQPVELRQGKISSGGAVFLRVTAPAFDQVLFVTVHILTSEIP